MRLRDETRALLILNSDSCLLTPFKSSALRILGRPVHRGRALYDAAAHKNLDLDAPVLLAAIARRVVCDRVRLAVAVRRDDAPERYLVVLDEVANHRVSAALAESSVRLDRAVGAREAAYLKHVALRLKSLLRDLIQLL